MRRGFTLVEVLIAGAVVASGLSFAYGLVQWSRRVAEQAARRDLSRTVATSALARLSSESFDLLARNFGSGVARRGDPAADKVLARSLEYMKQDVRQADLEVRADFRPAAGGNGFLQVAVSYPTGPESRDAVVLSRFLPNPEFATLARNSGSFNTTAWAPLSDSATASPLTRGNDALYRALLARVPTSELARALDAAMTLDRRDGKYDLDWTELARPGLEPAEEWRRLERALSGESLPDGIYALSEQPLDPGSHKSALRRRPARLTLLSLRDARDVEHFVLRQDFTDAVIPAVQLGAQAARDPGALEVRQWLGDGEARPVPAPVSLSGLVAGRRVWLFSDQLDGTGRRIPMVRRAGLFTSESEVEAPFLVASARMMGLGIAPLRGDDW